MDRIFQVHKPKNVLDVGCATGWYSLAAARCGAEVVAIDCDDEIVNSVYSQAKEHGARITPAVKNLFDDSPFDEKYRSEMVLALALVHHLVFSQHMSFEPICSTLAQYTEKRLIIEFMGLDDEFVNRHYDKTRHHFYTLDNLISVLRRHFGTIETMPSYPDNRTLVVCSN